MLEGAGTISPETAEHLTCDARRLVIQRHGRDLLHSRVERCATYVQLRALLARDRPHCRYPGCTADRELEAHHILAVEENGETAAQQPPPALAPATTSSSTTTTYAPAETPEDPVFTDHSRTPHHRRPASRTTAVGAPCRR